MTIPPNQIILPEPLGPIEAEIRGYIRTYPLDQILIGLRLAYNDTQIKLGAFARFAPFTIAAATRFALRWGTPGRYDGARRQAVDPNVLMRLLDLSMTHALADPAPHDSSVPGSFLSIMLRMVGNQFPFNADPTGKWGRAQVLFNEIPDEIYELNGVPKFDFKAKFEISTGVTVADFIDTAMFAFSAANGKDNFAFTRGYFDKARADGFNVPSDLAVKAALACLTLDSVKHAQQIEEFHQPDRRFAAYDFNSLTDFPLIRPWPGPIPVAPDDDRILTTLPNLVAFRISSGIYYQMKKVYGNDFLEFFGHMFSEYVGHILRSFVQTNQLLCETEIRRMYPKSAGKVPDWVIIDGNTAVLIECKAARVLRRTYVLGDEDDLSTNVQKIVRGLVQMHEFRQAIIYRHPGIRCLHHCDRFISVVITWEQFYLSASKPFKDFIRGLVDGAVSEMEFALLSLDELEWLQVHLHGEIGVSEIFERVLKQPADQIMKWAHERTGQSYHGSFLERKESQLYERIGLSNAAATHANRLANK